MPVEMCGCECGCSNERMPMFKIPICDSCSMNVHARPSPWPSIPGPEGETEQPCRYCGGEHTTMAHRKGEALSAT